MSVAFFCSNKSLDSLGGDVGVLLNEVADDVRISFRNIFFLSICLCVWPCLKLIDS